MTVDVKGNYFCTRYMYKNYLKKNIIKKYNKKLFEHYFKVFFLCSYRTCSLYLVAQIIMERVSLVALEKEKNQNNFFFTISL